MRRILPHRHPQRDQRLWPLLLLMAVAVLLPAGGVLWFMGRAVENESLAARQKLEGIYRSQLAGIRDRLAEDWRRRAAELEDDPPGTPPAAIFARVLEAGTADSAIVLDEGGRPAYPAPAVPPSPPPGHPSAAWREAVRLEGRDREAAASAWARIAGETADRNLAGRAFRARIRCLLQLDRRGEALTLLLDELAGERLASARDARGRLIGPSARLLALQLLEDPSSDEFRLHAGRLRQRLESYAEPALPAPQRRFLMRQLAHLAADSEPFPTSEAEELAARFVDSDPDFGDLAGGETPLAPSPLPGVWQLPSPGGRVIALYREETLERELAAWAGYFAVPGETTLEFLPASAEPDPQDPPLVTLPADDPLPGWRLDLHLDRDNFYRLAAARQIRAYRGTAALVVGLILLFSLLAGLTLRHQLRLTALKNDLLSTVSHELKTPLASMRLLIDTLLAGGRKEPERVKEYLEIMAAENERLSHLVENFLTFSRLSHGRQRFQRDELDPQDVAEEAVTAAGERLTEPGCRFEMEAEPDLPVLVGDRDALATAVLNLLDNAWKFSGSEKHIRLRTYAENGRVCFAVSDDGVGLTPREASRVFDRFYQADRRLSRGGGGCGLGLSIVRLIAGAHGGEVAVESRRGRGSTFTLRLPAGPREEPPP